MASVENCTVCSKEAPYMCSLCGTSSAVRYCSVECQQADWSSHSQSCIGRQQDPEAAEQERRRDIKFYITQLAEILKPVFLTLIFSVLWVKITHPTLDYYGTLSSRTVSIGATFGSSGGSNDINSLYIALIILGQIIIATVLFACAFKYGKAHYVYYLIGIVVTATLGYFGQQLGAALLALANFPLDWITFAFCLWNFVIVGVISIFWKGPVILKQAYLVIMSSMMAYNLSQLPSLVAWIMLGLLAVWDLIAVLCPYGPLRIMLESSQRNNQELPAALIYTVMVWMMAEPAKPPKQSHPEQTLALTNAAGSSNQGEIPENNAKHITAVISPSPVLANKDSSTSFASGLSSRDATEAIEQRHLNESIELQAPNNPSAPQEDEDEETGLKLGLGDFVFYSVLVGQASLFDWITTVSTMIAVTTGLCLTIFLLVVYEKPLPALPISIAVGVLFYFLSSLTLKPMADSLIPRPPFENLDQGLYVGTAGTGFVFL